MNGKSFFKSTTFKCIVSLLVVLLISGIFLTIMNSLLAVSPEEKFQRAISKIYGKSVRTETLATEKPNSSSDIDEAYRIRDDGNYLIKATGYGGYDSGSVTCWVVVEVSGGSISGIGKVVIDSNKAQSYISRVTDSALNQFGEIYVDGIFYTQDLITNATVAGTKTAICNAVNGAIDFVNGRLGNTTEDPYAEFAYIANITTRSTTHTYNEKDGSVTFNVVSNGYGMAAAFTSEIVVNADGTIRSFEVIVSGSTDQSYTDLALNNVNRMFIGKNEKQILAILGGTEYPGNDSGKWLVSGASNSTFSLYNAALFAAANYEKCIPAEGGEENE